MLRKKKKAVEIYLQCGGILYICIYIKLYFKIHTKFMIMVTFAEDLMVIGLRLVVKEDLNFICDMFCFILFPKACNLY